MSDGFAIHSEHRGPMVGDRMIALHYFDNTHLLRSMIMCLTVKFDDVLDANTLHESLKQLIKHDHWRKLGGRLRLAGRYYVQVRVLLHYSDDRPALRFSHAQMDVSMKNDPIVSKLHQPTLHPSIQPGVEDFRPLTGANNGPASIKDYYRSDLPQILLHVVTFTDGTLVSLTWPHTMTDEKGWGDIFRAWSAVLAGNLKQVPDYRGFDTDHMGYTGLNIEVERSLLYPEKRDLPARLENMAHRTARVVHDPRMESRIFCISSANMKKIKHRSTYHRTSNYWVSEMDIIKGWAANIACKHMGSSLRSVNIHSTLDLRQHYSNIFNVEGVYIQNATFPYIAQRSAKDMAHGPFGDTAVAMRRAYCFQKDREQIVATAKLFRNLGVRDCTPVLGDRDGHHIHFVDWASVDIQNAIDFSPALVRSDGDGNESAATDTAGNATSAAGNAQSGTNGAGKPAYFHSDIISKSDLMGQDVFDLYGWDQQGNYWIGAVLHRKAMRNFDDEFLMLQADSV